MNSSTKGTKRTANFTSAETELLVTLVKKYKNTIECLKTDTVNAKMKRDTWDKIQDEFNSQLVENPRTSVVLKNKYENIKRSVKKQYAEEKTFSRGTGGGPLKLFPVSSVASTVGELLQSRMTGETSVYDSDNCNAQLETEPIMDEMVGYYSENDEDGIITLTNFSDIFSDDKIVEKPTTKYELEKEVTQNKPSSSNTKKDWTNYTPADLKSKSTLTTASGTNVSKKQKTYQDKISSWASTRSSLCEQQQSAFIEQHQLKMQLMQKTHDAEQKRLAEKHVLEMKILELQHTILEQQIKPN